MSSLDWIGTVTGFCLLLNGCSTELPFEPVWSPPEVSNPMPTVSESIGSDTDAETTALNPTPDAEIVALEESIHAQINQYRQSRGLAPLALNGAISDQARLHSQAMASGETSFSHTGFEKRVEAIAQSVTYQSAAENVAYNQGYSDAAQQAVAGWLNSPGHLENIQGNYDLTGIGVARNSQGEYYFTQIFLQSR